MATVFNVNEESISIDSSIDNVENWDSLNHTNLVVALEQGFDVTFEVEEIIEMLSFEIIALILKQKLT